MRSARQTGRLGDLAEIPWGTPDADQLLRLLRHEIGPAALDRGAAAGTLRELCSEGPGARELQRLLDRPQRVRHTFRGDLDWNDPQVLGVFEALVTVFCEDGSSEDVCRLARVDLSGVDLDRPAREVWVEVMDRAAHQGTLERLIDQTLTDVAVGAHQDVLEAARDRPWRVETEPPPVAARRPVAPPPAPVVESLDAIDDEWEPLAPRRWPLLVAAAALAGGLGVAGWAATRPGPPPPPPPPPPPSPVAIAGALAMSGAEGRLVLTRAGESVAEIPATSEFAFPPQMVDADGDGAIDHGWSVALALTSSPCPSLPLPLRAGGPSAQQWTVPVARAALAADGCRVDVTGLGPLAAGAVVELDRGTVEPRRFAVVEAVEGGVAHAVAIGPWATCAACWPEVGSCVAAAERVTAPIDAARLVERASCPDSVAERLRAMIPPPVVEAPPPKPHRAPTRKRRR